LEKSDADLLRAAARGDADSFHALVDRHAAPLYQAALSMSRNAADAEDLVQETLVSAFRGASGFAGRSSVRTWMLQILTRHAARAWKRGARRRATLSLDAAAAPSTGAGAGAGARAGAAYYDRALSTPAATTAVDHRLDVADLLQGLSADHREILVKREIWNLSYDEIAAQLGIPRGTVESRLFRARASFRELLERRGEARR
jgi:RNA polymerase sigma-70 factor (ECF subfamily)